MCRAGSDTAHSRDRSTDSTDKNQVRRRKKTREEETRHSSTNTLGDASGDVVADSQTIDACICRIRLNWHSAFAAQTGKVRKHDTERSRLETRTEAKGEQTQAAGAGAGLRG